MSAVPIRLPEHDHGSEPPGSSDRHSHAKSRPLGAQLAAAKQNRMRGIRVLVVDDVPMVANTLGALLLFEGYVVFTAYSAEEALCMAAELRPDVLVSDVIMADMNGIDLAIRVCELWPMCRVLLISGELLTVAVLEERGRAGVQFDVLAKPANPKDVLTFVASSRETVQCRPGGEVLHS